MINSSEYRSIYQQSGFTNYTYEFNQFQDFRYSAVYFSDSTKRIVGDLSATNLVNLKKKKNVSILIYKTINPHTIYFSQNTMKYLNVWDYLLPSMVRNSLKQARLKFTLFDSLREGETTMRIYPAQAPQDPQFNPIDS